jgi:hypothetical protein
MELLAGCHLISKSFISAKEFPKYMFTREEEKELMIGFAQTRTGRLMIGIGAGLGLYLAGLFGTHIATDLLIGKTIHTQTQLEEVIDAEARDLGLIGLDMACALLSSGNEASYTVYKDGKIGVFVAGRKANVYNVRKLLYQIHAGIGLKSEVKYSDLLVLQNAIFYGITGGLKGEDF